MGCVLTRFLYETLESLKVISRKSEEARRYKIGNFCFEVKDQLEGQVCVSVSSKVKVKVKAKVLF